MLNPPFKRAIAVMLPALLALSACGGGKNNAVPQPSGGAASGKAIAAHSKHSKKSGAGAISQTSSNTHVSSTTSHLTAHSGTPAHVNPEIPGPGVTSKTIAIGAANVNNLQAVNAGFGVKGSAIDFKQAQQAIVAYLNSNGGIAGRRIDAQYFGFDGTSSQSNASQAQTMCTNYTENVKVMAVIGFSTDPITSASCLGDHGVAYFQGEGIDVVGDQPFFSKYRDYYYTPSYLNTDRQSTIWVQGLAKQGFLDHNKKFGLVYYSYQADAVKRTLLPALHAHGITIATADQFETTFPSVSSAGNLVADMQNAVLKFSNDHVSNVMLFDSRATMAVFFMKEADNQQWYPHYGLNSMSAPEFLKANASAAQMKNAIFVGWLPRLDITNPSTNNANETKCFNIMTKAGITMTSGDDKNQVLDLCDGWFLLKAGLERVGIPNVVTFRKGVDALGATYASPRTYRTRFASSRAHDGVDAWRPSKYDVTCSCFVSAGSITSMN